MVVCIALPPALGFENVFQMFGAWTDEVFVLIDTYNILDSREETYAECNELNIQEILKGGWYCRQYNFTMDSRVVYIGFDYGKVSFSHPIELK